MILYIFTLLAVAISAVSGALEAGNKKFDLMGVTVIAVVTALGGGTIRDLLLDLHPISWIGDINYLIVALFAAFSTFAFSYFYKPPTSFLLYADALGLALFTILGTLIAQEAKVPALIAVMMGTVTGVAGGVLRDTLCAEIPLLFRPSETLYGTAAICGSTLYLILEFSGFNQNISASIGMLAVAGLRIAAIVCGLRLPEFRQLRQKN